MPTQQSSERIVNVKQGMSNHEVLGVAFHTALFPFEIHDSAIEIRYFFILMSLRVKPSWA